MTNRDLQPPNATKGDAAHAIVKAGLSAVPLVGGPAAELFQHLVQPPLERRRLEWMTSVGEKLEELEERGVDIAELGKNEEFVSAVMHATQIALRSHQIEKRDALRNAVFNVASGFSAGDALEFMFFEWIDSLSVLHLKVLVSFQSPSKPPGLSMGGLGSVLEFNMPQLKGQREVYDLIWKDLYSRGLLNTESLHVTMSGHGLSEKRTTKIGDLFIQFISEPNS